MPGRWIMEPKNQEALSLISVTPDHYPYISRLISCSKLYHILTPYTATSSRLHHYLQSRVKTRNLHLPLNLRLHQRLPSYSYRFLLLALFVRCSVMPVHFLLDLSPCGWYREDSARNSGGFVWVIYKCSIAKPIDVVL